MTHPNESTQLLMKALPAIARYMRLPEDQLRYPVELIQQGYEPNYLATYRPDELGGIDVQTLARLKRAVEYETKLADHKEKVLESLERDQQCSEPVVSVIEECTSVSQVDAVARMLRSKRNAKSFAENKPNVEILGKAILMAHGDAPADMNLWIVEQTGVAPEAADELLGETKRWLQLLMCEDAKLILQLQRGILKNSVVTLTILPEPAKGEEAEHDVEVSPTPVTQGLSKSSEPVSKAVPSEEPAASELPVAESELPVAEDQPPASEMPLAAEVPTDSEPQLAAEVPTDSEPQVAAEVPTDSELQVAAEVPTDSELPVAAEVPTDSELPVAVEVPPNGELTPSGAEPAVAEASPVAPLIEQFHQGRKQNKAIRTKSLSDKQLSPRQRRRRWLRNILESYSKLKKSVRALTPYQVLMFSRGMRSRIVELNFQQDLRPLVQACRDSLCPNRHPMHPMLMEIAETGLKEVLLPRLHQDVISILEEDANQELIEASVLHLQSSLLQRPLRGHRILMIDAVGLKTAAIAIVDADGTVLKTAEIPCNSSKPDVVAQNLSTLGQLVHEYRVTLVGLSNGVARRYLIHSIVELLKQSSEGSLYWTLVDRAGCDAYTLSRNSLVELSRISRRHRAAVWLAWRLQDPLQQILKIDPARMRLGSYQRELPQSELESALQESVSAALTKAGVDVFSADIEVLKRIPGMTEEAAQRVAAERQSGTITNRDSLMQVLRESLNEMQARQAIGFLRVHGSDNAFDATIIHPEDYRLAQRLIAHAEFPVPEAQPEGWQKPDYEKIAATRAAVANLSIEGTLADSTASDLAEPIRTEINPNFGVLDSDTSTETDPASTEAEAASDADESSVESDATVDPTVDDTVAAVELENALGDAPTEVAAATEESVATEEAAATEEATTTDEASADESSADEASADELLSTDAPALIAAAPAHMPVIPTGPMACPSLSVDAEKLARSWQVGRAKLMSVAGCLQFPFADVRDYQFPVAIRSHVPRLDLLPQGTMLTALVIGVADFGVFAELGPDCSGLVHISRLASDFVEDPHQFVQVGDVIPVWVVNVDEKRKRVSLTAIPPGTPDRKREGSYGDSTDDRSDQSRNRRPERSDRSTSSTGSNRGGADASGAPRAGAAGSQSQSRPSDGNRGRRDGARSGSGTGGGRPGQQGGRGGYAGKGRGRQDQDHDKDSSQRRPVRIDKPQPQKPISEAMQQGKEPLRSFSDLMQYMKQGKPPAADETPESTTQKPAATEMPAVESGTIPAQEGNSLESDANSTA